MFCVICFTITCPVAAFGIRRWSIFHHNHVSSYVENVLDYYATAKPSISTKETKNHTDTGKKRVKSNQFIRIGSCGIECINKRKIIYLVYVDVFVLSMSFKNKICIPAVTKWMRWWIYILLDENIFAFFYGDIRIQLMRLRSRRQAVCLIFDLVFRAFSLSLFIRLI